MCQGLLEESDGEGEPGQDKGPEAGGEQAEGAEASVMAMRPAAVEKKTEQQRRREKAARKMVSAAGPPPRLTLTACLTFCPVCDPLSCWSVEIRVLVPSRPRLCSRCSGQCARSSPCGYLGGG